MAAISPTSIRAGTNATVSYNLTNEGAGLQYWESLCPEEDGNGVLSIQVVNPQGHVVHPSRPSSPDDPTCLAPSHQGMLAHGERLSTNFTWEGWIYDSSEDADGHAAPPGLYDINAGFSYQLGEHDGTVWANVTLEIRDA